MGKKKSRGKVWIDESFCKGTEGCNLCVHVCPEDVIGASERLSIKGVHTAVVKHPERCTGCEWCMLYCPELAVTVERPKEAQHA